MPYTQLAPTYTLPAASTSTLGGIKTDGTITTLDANNVLQISKNDLLAGTGTGSIALATSEYSASGTNAILIGGGRLAAASGANSIAIGTDAEAVLENDIAIGAESYASGYDASNPGLAIGANANVPNGGIQLGSGTTTSRNDFNVGIASSNFKLLDLSTGLIPSARIPGATVANAGKYLTINSSGEIVAADLPLYNGGVS